MWEAAVTLGAEALLDGFSSVRRCSLEGRAAMSLDLSAVEKGLRAVAPAAVMSSLRVVRRAVGGVASFQGCQRAA
jgi:hypothetical protein